MKKRILAAILTGAMIAGTMMTGTVVMAEEQTTIHVYTSFDIESLLDLEIEAYKAVNPNVTIEKHIIPEDDYDDKIKVLLAGANEDIDVFWTRSPAQTQQFMTVNAMEDLSSYVEASGVDVSSIKDTALASVADEEGGFYGLPIYSTCWMLFYNKDLFDAAGVEYPGQMTWDEYCTLAEQLTHTAEDGTTYWGGQCPPWTMNLGASSNGELLTSDDLTYTMKYAEVLKRMYDNSHVPYAEMSGGAWDNDAYFSAGNIYMNILGDWGYRNLNVDFEYGTAPLPVFEDVEAGSSVGQACYWAISSGSANKQAAYDFIEFATLSDEGTSAIASLGSVPSYSTDAAMEVYKEKVTVDGVDYRFAAKVLAEGGAHSAYAEINDNFVSELSLYLLGEESLEECFDNFRQIREEIMSE